MAALNVEQLAADEIRPTHEIRSRWGEAMERQVRRNGIGIRNRSGRPDNRWSNAAQWQTIEC